MFYAETILEITGMSLVCIYILTFTCVLELYTIVYRHCLYL